LQKEKAVTGNMQNVNLYGRPPYNIAVIHGGPGAAGEVKPVAVKLAEKFGVIEPYQTELTVQAQLDELNEQVTGNSSKPVTLAGYSYGAWLAYIFASQFPEKVKKLILISSGSFDEKHNINMLDKRLSRLSTEEAEEARDLQSIISGLEYKQIENEFTRFGELISKADTFEAIDGFNEPEIIYRTDIHQAIWNEAKELRRTGALLDFGYKIKCPVTAIHGDYDPHPAAGVKEPLENIIKDFKFILLKKCGHTPWREKFAREKFYEILDKELTED
jgi:pimeloyl-ACP methyl ester carboxylesterase